MGLSFGAAGGANVRDPLALLCRTFSMLRCEVITSRDRRARVVASSQPLRVSLCSFQPWSYCCVMGFTGILLSLGIFLVICYVLFSACFLQSPLDTCVLFGFYGGKSYRKKALECLCSVYKQGIKHRRESLNSCEVGNLKQKLKYRI